MRKKEEGLEMLGASHMAHLRGGVGARVAGQGEFGDVKEVIGQYAPFERAANCKNSAARGVLVAERTMDRLVMQSSLRRQPSAILAFFMQNQVNRMIFYASRHMCLHAIRRYLAHICAFVNNECDINRLKKLRLKEPRF
nr:hypothetical protein [Cohaesibacter sp. ES.047]